MSDPVLDKADGSINSSSQRDWYLLRWADQLQGDEGVWRIALHYLSFVMASDDDSLAEAAEARMKATLKHVKWQDPTVPSASASNAATSELTNGGTGGNATVNDEKRDDVKETTVEDVLQACYEYGFKDVAVDVCKVGSIRFHTNDSVIKRTNRLSQKSYKQYGNMDVL